MTRNQNKAQVLLLCAVVLIVGVIALLWTLARQQKMPVEFDFSDASGLEKGAAIEAKGIHVGTIESLSLGPQGRVKVLASLQRKASESIPEDSTATVRKKRDKTSYIDLTLGQSEFPVEENQVIQGYTGPPEKSLDDLHKVIESIGQRIRELRAAPETQTALNELRDLSGKLDEYRQRAMSEENMAKLREIASQIEDLGQKSYERLTTEAPVLLERINTFLSESNAPSAVAAPPVPDRPTED